MYNISMNLPEDRHPLLHVCLNNDETESVRSHYASQGATLVLGKWPDHIKFTWMMSIIGLLTFLACFLLTFASLVLFSSGDLNSKSYLIDKCERNEHSVHFVHLRNSEEITVNENATYFVEIFTNDSKSFNSACSVESYLKQTTLPVFLVAIFANNSMENLHFTFSELMKKFNNFKTITFDLDTFFSEKVSNLEAHDLKFLSFLAKVLVSWNVGGTVLDSSVLTLKDFKNILQTDDKFAQIGVFKKDVVLIKTKRFCHAYIFEVLKTLTAPKNFLNYSEYEIIKRSEERFCQGRLNCTRYKLISMPYICNFENIDENCSFLIPKFYGSVITSSHNSFWKTFCPIVQTLV